AAGHRPLRGMSGVRAAVTLLGFHEQKLVLGAIEDLDDFRHRRRVNPVFRVHEKPVASFDSGTSLFHFFQDALVHKRFWYVSADRRFIASAPEIAGEW